MFELKYDYLVCAMGCKTNTFGTPGVAEREGKDVFFLKHLWHARQIRQRTIACFERASMPGISEAERSSLLSFIVVGGGPTSCEFVTELHDFLRVDVARWYPDLAKLVRVTVVEAGPYILGSFDRALVDFYKKSLLKKDIDVRTETAVVGVREGPHPKEDFDWTIARLDNGAQIPFGMMVWSAGLAPVKFTENCNLPMDSKNGRIVIDDYLRYGEDDHPPCNQEYAGGVMESRDRLFGPQKLAQPCIMMASPSPLLGPLGYKVRVAAFSPSATVLLIWKSRCHRSPLLPSSRVNTSRTASMSTTRGLTRQVLRICRHQAWCQHRSACPSPDVSSRSRRSFATSMSVRWQAWDSEGESST
mmetsp:Transcript_5331/g.16322  ORF Transcript_5331/g.16322 Transcript_5331/m.16322 type:complete len:359 (-) Transcript_5331:276-1352(-)